MAPCQRLPPHAPAIPHRRTLKPKEPATAPVTPCRSSLRLRARTPCWSTVVPRTSAPCNSCLDTSSRSRQSGASASSSMIPRDLRADGGLTRQRPGRPGSSAGEAGLDRLLSGVGRGARCRLIAAAPGWPVTAATIQATNGQPSEAPAFCRASIRKHPSTLGPHRSTARPWSRPASIASIPMTAGLRALQRVQGEAHGRRAGRMRLHLQAGLGWPYPEQVLAEVDANRIRAPLDGRADVPQRGEV